LLCKFGFCNELGQPYQKGSSHQDENTVFVNWLAVDGVGAVLYLLEGEVLLVLARASLWQTGIPTWSFSTIAATPRVPFASKVSMEWSRCPSLYEPRFHSRVFCHVRKAPLGLRGWSRIAHSRTRRTALGAQVSRRPRPLWDWIVKVGETYCRFAQKKLPKWLVAWRI
jgi:hypothetical protein